MGFLLVRRERGRDSQPCRLDSKAFIKGKIFAIICKNLTGVKKMMLFLFLMDVGCLGTDDGLVDGATGRRRLLTGPFSRMCQRFRSGHVRALPCCRSVQASILNGLTWE